MKAIGAISGSLHKNLDAKNGNGASADAARLEELFGKVHEYWLTKSPDAMKFAMDSQAGYREIAAKASAGNFTEALATFKTVSANCGGCHAAHREKAADGTWKIK
jgi:mono/diheme cytochrome c family protein